MSLPPTPSQTVGPYFHFGLDRLSVSDLARPGVSGERITIRGQVLDGDGQGVPDAMIEIWQANAHGKYGHIDDPQDKPLQQEFTGYGRVPTNEAVSFRFSTVKPGRVPGPGEKLQAPHLAVSVFMRGLLTRLVTRVYFPSEANNDEDHILNLVDAQRRGTLIARNSQKNKGELEWNIILQGPEETVFFDC